jgi:hypothetical protein
MICTGLTHPESSQSGTRFQPIHAHKTQLSHFTCRPALSTTTPNHLIRIGKANRIAICHLPKVTMAQIPLPEPSLRRITRAFPLPPGTFYKYSCLCFFVSCFTYRIHKTGYSRFTYRIHKTGYSRFTYRIHKTGYPRFTYRIHKMGIAFPVLHIGSTKREMQI